MVPATGLEPVRCYSLEPESSASANSATRAYRLNHVVQEEKIRTSGVPCKREVRGGGMVASGRSNCCNPE
jgi:hypothetical protein